MIYLLRSKAPDRHSIVAGPRTVPLGSNARFEFLSAIIRSAQPRHGHNDTCKSLHRQAFC